MSRRPLKTPAGRLVALLAVLLAASLVISLAGCGGAEPEPLQLNEAVADGRFVVNVDTETGFSFHAAPRLQPVTSDHVHRPAVVLPPGTWSWRGRLPERATLFVGAAVVSDGEVPNGVVTERQPAEGDEVQATPLLTLTVGVRHGSRTDIVAVAHGERPGNGDAPGWLDLEVDLSAYGGDDVTVELAAVPQAASLQPVSSQPEASDPLEIAWGPVSLRAQTDLDQVVERTRPNVLFIVVDTLRFDRLSCYGYERATTPEIDRWLADGGVRVENAYAQAPWTLPSVSSFFTSRYPGEILRGAMASFGIPRDARPMAEVFADLGYTTAGFNANPAIFPGNGFARGLESYAFPPMDFAWFHRGAEDLNQRALPWLRAHQHQPFFLWMQYLDPHDPYKNPDIVDGKSPFYPDYDGPFTGEMVHGIYAGAHELQNPQEDVAHLSALYDSEVHYVDRHIGELLSALEPEVLANTLIVLTADHGEELYDHGGWKHGQSLYDEQIRVPLLLRWDGRLPAGTTLDGGPVQLIDLLPTLAAAAGAEMEPQWQGENLLPALRGERPLPRRPAFAQHMSAGPLRAMSVLDAHKLFLFNRRTPFEPPDPLQGLLWQKDLQRFEDVELYDLEADPSEQLNLLSAETERQLEPGLHARLDQLARVVHHQLERQVGGLRLVPAGLPAGSTLRGRLRLDQPAESWNAYFLGPDELVRLHDDALDFALRTSLPAGTAVPGHGLLVQGDFGRLEALDVTLTTAEGETLDVEVKIAGGVPYSGGPVPRAQLRAPAWPLPASSEEPTQEPTLYVWLSQEPVALQAEENPETRRRLIALGYVQ